MPVFGGSNISLALGGQGSDAFAVPPGQDITIPAGTYNIASELGYTSVAVYDPISTTWRAVGNDTVAFKQIASDGTNYRLQNTTGCCIGALLTQAGGGYTSAPTVTVSSATGAAKAIAIVGGAVGTSPSVTNGGSNYTYPPQVVIAAPPAPGIQATGYATLTSGAVSSVTITNQGAGYLTPPLIALVNDPRDTTGQGATVVLSLTGAQTVTGVLITDHGSAQTALPTLSFSGGGGASAVAVAIMDWTVTAYAVAFPGAGFAGAYEIRTLGTGIPTTTPAYTNPQTQTQLLRTRPASIIAALASTGFTATGQLVVDGGRFGGTASNLSILEIGGTGQTALPTTAATLTLAVGGTNDHVYMLRA